MVFNPTIAAERRGRLAQHQTLLQQLLQQRQSADSEYNLGMGELNQQKPGTFRGLLNNFASRGLGYSSGYGQAVTDTNNQFANQESRLASDRTNAYASADAASAGEDASFQYDLSGLAAQQAAYDASNKEQAAAMALQNNTAQSVINKNNAAAKAKAAPKPAPKVRRPAGPAGSGVRTKPRVKKR